MQEKERWQNYYKATSQKPPNSLLLDVLTRFDAHSAAKSTLAIDLGCGNGQDSHALLRHGWRVLSIDKQPEAIRNTLDRAPVDYRQHLEARVSAFEGLTLPRCHLIYAGVSLPFCAPASFAQLWATIDTALAPGGMFVGNFFGVHDEWASRPDMTFHTRTEVQALFAGFEVETLTEIEEDSRTAAGTPKYWHLFAVVAQKI